MKKEIIPASASRVVQALSNIGYSLQSSICDIIDNSISHGVANNIYICFDYLEPKDKFYFMIYDDGKSMSESKLKDAIRLGSSKENYLDDDLGKFGMGLKTASLAHCNTLSVIAKQKKSKKSSCVILDKILIQSEDKWVYSILNDEEINEKYLELKQILKRCYTKEKFFLSDTSYTFLVWEDLFLMKNKSDKASSGAQISRQITKEQLIVEAHLRMVFHRFLNEENGARKVNIYFNGSKLNGWNPCLPNLKNTVKYTDKNQANKEYLGFKFDPHKSEVKIKRYILPKKSEIEKYSDKEDLIITEKSHTNKVMKIDKWQGLYFYRNNRLIDYGGWYDGTGTEPHITYARASVDLTSDHDQYFSLNINKSKISIDNSFKTFLKENMPKFRQKAKELYGKKKVETKNSVRDSSDKLKEIIKVEGDKNEIEIKGPNRNNDKTNVVEVSNIIGKFVDHDKKYLKQSSELLKKKIISEELSDDQLLWEVIPDPQNVMLVKINSLHEIYKLYYEDENKKNEKITAVIDSIIISLAFTELCYKTEKTEQLFEDINRTTGKLLNKLVDNKIVKK
jgi:hypothetical protein